MGLHVSGFAISRSMLKTMLRLLFTASHISKVDLLHVAIDARIEERVVTVGSLGKRSIVHRLIWIGCSMELIEFWLTNFVTGRHREDLTWFGSKAFLKLTCEMLSNDVGRIKCIVNDKRSVIVWDRLETIVGHGGQIGGC